MPKLLFARPPCDAAEEWHVRKLAGARHAPGDWIRRTRMITLSWQGGLDGQLASPHGRPPRHACSLDDRGMRQLCWPESLSARVALPEILGAASGIASISI
jgi:hypothetical protein